MLTDDEKIITKSLVKNGDIEALLLYLNKINENKELEKDVDLYELYIEKEKPTCKACNKLITLEDYKSSIIKTRNMDCAYTDWMIGCCCCGSGPEYHKPECAQFFCSNKCFIKAKQIRMSINNYDGKEYFQMCSTKYSDSAHLFDKII